MTSKSRRPSIACEFSATQVVAACTAGDGVIHTSSARALRPGALVPMLAGNNVADPAALRTALQETLAVLGAGKRQRDLAAILPDACCRLVLIDLDVLPVRRQEAEVLIRHRVKKSLPFDVDDARLSWQVQQVNGKTTVLAAATHKAVLEEYESVVRQTGFSPGVVLPSILASLRLVDAGVPTLVIKIDAATTSIAIVNEGAVLLVRVLDRARDNAKLVDDVYASLVFFQDAYGTKVQRILVSSLARYAELNSLLEQSTGLHPQELVGFEQLDPACENERSTLGAVAGALA